MRGLLERLGLFSSVLVGYGGLNFTIWWVTPIPIWVKALLTAAIIAYCGANVWFVVLGETALLAGRLPYEASLGYVILLLYLAIPLATAYLILLFVPSPLRE